jgi:hypothetical protein
MMEEGKSRAFFQPPVKGSRVIEPLLEPVGKAEARSCERGDEAGGHLGGGFLLVAIHHEDPLPGLKQMPREERAGKSLPDNEKVSLHRSGKEEGRAKTGPGWTIGKVIDGT